MKLWKDQQLSSEEYVRQTMPHTVGTFELLMMVMLYMFTITNPIGTISAGAAGISYWIVGGIVFFIPTVIATAQLAKMFPHEGSTYVWTHKALGGFWSFFATITFWLPGMLAMIGFATTVVSILQGLNSAWLTEPWQQGLLTIGLLLLSTVLSLQRFRVLLHLVSAATIITYAIVLLIGLTAVAWVLTGHHVATDLAPHNWSLNGGNLGLFGTVVIAYLGIDAPLVVAGERKQNFSVRKALFWGSLAVLAAYLIISFALVIVEGPTNVSQIGNFSVIAVIQQMFGKAVADVVTVAALAYFPIFLALNGSLFARLLMTTSIDRRLPVGLARLNKNRVPGNAIIFQSIVMVIFVAIAFGLPYIIPLGKPADLNSEVVTITLSMMTLVWSISTVFMFLDLFIFYLRDRAGFVRQRIFPMPVLWFCIIVAPIACVLAIILTLAYSPLPQLSADQWKYIVGGLTVMCLVICATVSLYATSEAAWQDQVSTVVERRQ